MSKANSKLSGKGHKVPANGVRVVIVVDASRFARELTVPTAILKADSYLLESWRLGYLSLQEVKSQNSHDAGRCMAAAIGLSGAAQAASASGQTKIASPSSMSPLKRSATSS